MRRREFITLIGGAAVAWPVVARAQQAMPVIGFLHGEWASRFKTQLAGFHMGLKDGGFVEGQNRTARQ
jgi:putative ABC transport system substrate-binding protein